MNRVLKNVVRVALVIAMALLFVVAAYVYHHIGQVEKIEQAWQATEVERLGNFGSTKQLRITPLVNWRSSRPELKTEAGVAYFLETDEQQILFDVGFNKAGEKVSPLQHNMKALGIDMSSIDTVFLSHHHLDHSGGQNWVSRASFSMGTKQSELADVKIFAPVALEYPGSKVTTVRKPQVVGRGLASIGPIRRRLFMGGTEEQALAINLAGKGIVLVVGCGHQTLGKILQRYDQLFDQPLYGIIGDLHYPVPNGRLTLFGINLQRYLASGTGPWSPLTALGVEADMKLLALRNPAVVGLGGHDSSDDAIVQFSKYFAERYRAVEVGRVIEIK